MPTDDMALLREYVRSHSEDAFATLVARHINLVHSVALRQVRDAHLAQEVTQVVFILLARKAGALSSTTILSGWLCRTASYAAANVLTLQRRRQSREQEAFMQSVLNDIESEAWTHIAPLLDPALARLGAKDHDAIVLRYFEGRSLNEVGVALGSSEEAAKKRVNRALEKLRRFFSKRGVTLTTTLIAGAVTANSVQAAPVALAVTIAAATAKGAALSGSTLALVKGALKLMAWSKVKTSVGVGMILLVAGVGTVAVKKHFFPSEPSNQHRRLTATYQVSGSTIKDYVMADGSIKTVSNWFRVVVADCRSRITAGGAENARIEYFEYCCDGTNSSMLIKHVPHTNSANQATLTLNTGPVPEWGNGQISQVWLAYASACFYLNSTSEWTDAVFFMGNGFRENHLKVQSQWKLTTSVPPVLEHMCDFSDGYRYNEQDEILLKEKMPSPFDRENTNATYSVLQWTNYQGLTLPLEWQVVHYMPTLEPNLANGKLEPRMTIHGYTTSVGTGAADMDFVPSVPKVTLVIDDTLEAQGVPMRSYEYFAPDGRLRTLAEIKRDPDFKSALQEGRRVWGSPATR
jgi:RNA polymerase sigma factor (sigma-70 family)